LLVSGRLRRCFSLSGSSCSLARWRRLLLWWMKPRSQHYVSLRRFLRGSFFSHTLCCKTFWNLVNALFTKPWSKRKSNKVPVYCFPPCIHPQQHLFPKRFSRIIHLFTRNHQPTSTNQWQVKQSIGLLMTSLLHEMIRTDDFGGEIPTIKLHIMNHGAYVITVFHDMCFITYSLLA
jgi:hypothetical protein